MAESSDFLKEGCAKQELQNQVRKYARIANMNKKKFLQLFGDKKKRTDYGKKFIAEDSNAINLSEFFKQNGINTAVQGDVIALAEKFGYVQGSTAHFKSARKMDSFIKSLYKVLDKYEQTKNLPVLMHAASNKKIESVAGCFDAFSSPLTASSINISKDNNSLKNAVESKIKSDSKLNRKVNKEEKKIFKEQLKEFKAYMNDEGYCEKGSKNLEVDKFLNYLKYNDDLHASMETQIGLLAHNKKQGGEIKFRTKRGQQAFLSKLFKKMYSQDLTKSGNSCATTFNAYKTYIKKLDVLNPSDTELKDAGEKYKEYLSSLSVSEKNSLFAGRQAIINAHNRKVNEVAKAKKDQEDKQAQEKINEVAKSFEDRRQKAKENFEINKDQYKVGENIGKGADGSIDEKAKKEAEKRLKFYLQAQKEVGELKAEGVKKDDVDKYFSNLEESLTKEITESQSGKTGSTSTGNKASEAVSEDKLKEYAGSVSKYIESLSYDEKTQMYLQLEYQKAIDEKAEELEKEYNKKQTEDGNKINFKTRDFEKYRRGQILLGSVVSRLGSEELIKGMKKDETFLTKDGKNLQIAEDIKEIHSGKDGKTHYMTTEEFIKACEKVDLFKIQNQGRLDVVQSNTNSAGATRSI